MNSIYSPNDSKSRKTSARSYFYERPCLHSLFNISTENIKLEWNHVSGIKLTESCRADGK